MTVLHVTCVHCGDTRIPLNDARLLQGRWPSVMFEHCAQIQRRRIVPSVETILLSQGIPVEYAMSPVEVAEMSERIRRCRTPFDLGMVAS